MQQRGFSAAGRREYPMAGETSLIGQLEGKIANEEITQRRAAQIRVDNLVLCAFVFPRTGGVLALPEANCSFSRITVLRSSNKWRSPRSARKKGSVTSFTS